MFLFEVETCFPRPLTVILTHTHTRTHTRTHARTHAHILASITLTHVRLFNSYPNLSQPPVPITPPFLYNLLTYRHAFSFDSERLHLFSFPNFATFQSIAPQNEPHRHLSL